MLEDRESGRDQHVDRVYKGCREDVTFIHSDLGSHLIWAGVCHALTYTR